VSTFPKTVDLKEFQKKLSEKYNISVYLDLNNEYVNWRIMTNPRLKYQSYFFYDKSQLIGYILFSIKDDRLSIADISVLDSAIGRHILSFVINRHSRNIASVYYFGNDDSQ